jgi:GT2 family glycosyltransferase
LPDSKVTVVVPTLHGGAVLEECLLSLANQTWTNFRAVVVDNSGQGVARLINLHGATVIENRENAGFGGAINQVWRTTRSEFVATLNDDAVADENWLESMMQSATDHPLVGMFASQVRLRGEEGEPELLDSAGMRIAIDGSSKQRGHGAWPHQFLKEAPVLCPSGSAAVYRRSMLDEVGAFDERFFLYCEDTDLGLRAQRLGWRCMYVPHAIVRHRYSHSAGRVSELKAFLVERNRLYLIVKNFPLLRAVCAVLAAPIRYLLSARAAIRGDGAASEFAESRSFGSIAWLILRAHIAALRALPWLLAERKRIRASSRLNDESFAKVLDKFAITLHEVASL